MFKTDSIKKLVKSGKAKNIIIALGVLGILLIFLSSLFSFGTEENGASSYDVGDFRENMQDSIAQMLAQIEGVGEVKVLLTVENSAEGVYLENNSTKTKEIEPVVRGVVVACGGGDDPVTVERVFDAVTKALSISNSKVCVTKLKE